MLDNCPSSRNLFVARSKCCRIALGRGHLPTSCRISPETNHKRFYGRVFRLTRSEWVVARDQRSKSKITLDQLAGPAHRHIGNSAGKALHALGQEARLPKSCRATKPKSGGNITDEKPKNSSTTHIIVAHVALHQIANRPSR